MPKIKDLGIKVIPETMKPPEIGGGGGGCSDCTVVQFSICGTTRCTDCTFQQCSIAGGVTGGCTDCTVLKCSIGGGLTHGCTDCTFQQCSIAGGVTRCTDCTFQQCSIAGGVTHGCTDCTFQQCSIAGGFTFACRQTCAVSVGCRLQTHCGPFSGWGGCGPVSPVCAGSIDPTIVQQPGVLTREQIAALKDALRKQITALEEHEKTIGPKTAEEIDAREKQLNEELAQLKERRKNLK